MGAWGYEEHENDDFLDYLYHVGVPCINVDSEEALLNLLSTRLDELQRHPKLLVGIVNKLHLLRDSASWANHVVPIPLLLEALAYLNTEIQLNDGVWKSMRERREAIIVQIERVKQALSAALPPRMPKL